MTPDTEKSGFGVEKNRQLGRGKIGASHRFNWSEESACLESCTALENHGHLSGGKATHCVSDIRHSVDSLALTHRCLTFDTAMSDIRQLVEKEL